MNIMKKLISLFLILSCLATLALAATVPTEAGKPIVTVTTGSNSVQCNDVEVMLENVDASGKTVITVLQDFSYPDAAIKLPYSCTIDFNGHTVTGCQDVKTNAFEVQAAGSENNITTLKNGTLLYGQRGLNVKGGGFAVTDMLMYGPIGEPVSPMDTNFEGNSLIENSTLIARDWGGMSFNAAGDHSKHTVTIKDSTLLTLNAGGCVLIDVDSKVTAGGNIVLGTGVKMYGAKINSFASSLNKVTGETATKNPETQTFELPELNIKATGLTLFETAPTPAPVVPETPVAPEAPATPVPEAPVPTTGVSVVALGVMAAVSLAGAVITKKH